MEIISEPPMSSLLASTGVVLQPRRLDREEGF